MTIQEQYIELQKCRKQQSSDVLNNRPVRQAQL